MLARAVAGKPEPCQDTWQHPARAHRICSELSFCCQALSFVVSCRTLNGLLELVKGVGKIQGSNIHEVSVQMLCHRLSASEPSSRVLLRPGQHLQ